MVKASKAQKCMQCACNYESKLPKATVVAYAVEK